MASLGVSRLEYPLCCVSQGQSRLMQIQPNRNSPDAMETILDFTSPIFYQLSNPSEFQLLRLQTLIRCFSILAKPHIKVHSTASAPAAAVSPE